MIPKPTVPIVHDPVESHRLLTQALNKVVDDINREFTKPLDAKMQRVVNVATPAGLYDAVNKLYVKRAIEDELPRVGSETIAGLDHYTIVFSKDGIIINGDAAAPFVVGTERAGHIVEVWLIADGQGTDTTAINISLTTGTTTTTVLSSSLVLPTASQLPVYSTSFTTNTVLARDMVVRPVIVNAGEAGLVSIGVVVRRV